MAGTPPPHPSNKAEPRQLQNGGGGKGQRQNILAWKEGSWGDEGLFHVSLGGRGYWDKFLVGCVSIVPTMVIFKVFVIKFRSLINTHWQKNNLRDENCNIVSTTYLRHFMPMVSFYTPWKHHK